MQAIAWHVCLLGKTGSGECRLRMTLLTQAVWKRARTEGAPCGVEPEVGHHVLGI